MKLCRFQLHTDPETPRSGIVHGGKVYETDGSQPIAVHEWTDAVLLAPIGRPPTIRLFTGARPSLIEWLQSDEAGAEAGPDYIYLNPSLMVGTQSAIPESPLSPLIGVKVCLGVVIGEAAHRITPDEAERLVLGYTIAAVLYAADVERNEMASSQGLVRSHEIGVAVGPALTTLDELEEALLPEEGASRYKIDFSASIDGAEAAQFASDEVPFAMADLASYASRTAPLMAGDLILLAMGSTAPHAYLAVGSELRIVTKNLGTLSLKYG
ncbi:MAG: fumarylacetoacetate hydrolase family protein [Armatimonadetes bacterium]|nr:fumarylacetoacetate hydrolase family protein [Armatimonadota bacterium]